MSQRIVCPRVSFAIGCWGPARALTRGLWAVLSLAAIAGTGCEDESTPACTPGETRLCAGPARCSGVQSCLADGSGYEEACDCSTPLPNGFGVDPSDVSSSTIVGRQCSADSDCGDGLTCLTSDTDTDFFGGGIANGYCSKSCSAPEDCTSVDAVAECVQTGNEPGYCLRTCASRTPPATESKCLGRLDIACRSVAYLGLEEPGFSRQRGWCYPQCNSDDECGDRVCNLASGLCTDAQPAGKAIGEKCTADEECIGNICLIIGNGPEDRLCSAPCRLGEPVSPLGCGYSVQQTPREASCIGPQVQTLLGNEGDGDMGFCLELCDVDADCAQNAEFGWECTPTEGFAQRTGRAGVCFLPQEVEDAGASDAAVLDSGAADSGSVSTSGPDASNAADASGG